MSSFTFDGINSKTKYIKAIRSDRVLVAKRKHTTIILPESDNIILIPDISREPIIIPVECLLYIPDDMTVFEIGRELDDWLSQDDWKSLIFEDDPNYSYRAICTSEIRVSDLRNKKSNVITLEFLCDPQIRGEVE